MKRDVNQSEVKMLKPAYFLKDHKDKISGIVLRIMPIFILSGIVSFLMGRYYGYYDYEMGFLSFYLWPQHSIHIVGMLVLIIYLSGAVLLIQSESVSDFSYSAAFSVGRSLFPKMFLPVFLYLLIGGFLMNVWYFLGLAFMVLGIAVPFAAGLHKATISESITLLKDFIGSKEFKQKASYFLFAGIITFVFLIVSTEFLRYFYTFGLSLVFASVISVLIWFANLLAFSYFYLYFNTLYVELNNIKLTDIAVTTSRKTSRRRIKEKPSAERTENRFQREKNSKKQSDAKSKSSKNKEYNRFEEWDKDDLSF